MSAGSTTTVADVGEANDVGATVNAEGLKNLALTIDRKLIEGACATCNQAVVDQAEVVNKVTLALILAFSCALAWLTANSAIGELCINSINSFLSNFVVVAGKLFSSFHTCACTLDSTLNRLHVGAGGEAGTAVSGRDDSSEN